MANETLFPDGFFGEVGDGAGDAPSAPSLSVTVSGTTATATIDGDAGATNYLFYKTSGDSSWTAGGNRSGDGDIEVASLSYGVIYIFVAISVASSLYSLPSQTVSISIAISATKEIDGILAEAIIAAMAANGETISYLPGGAGGRAIVVSINRLGVGGIGGMPQGNAEQFEVIVYNSNVTGISSTDIDTGLDLLSFPSRIGESNTIHRIKRLIAQNSAFLTLEA